MADAYYCPEGPGGNSVITNQDEAMILAATIGGVPVRGTALGMEDDSHVTTGYRDADVAGS
jgi:hypothetical protein